MIKEKDVLQVLKEVYYKKGRNYTFKTRHIAPYLGTNAYTIARYIPQIEKRGIVEIRDRTAKCIVYKTCFEEVDKK